MNAFIHRLLGSSDEAELRRTPSHSQAPELARLLFWCACLPINPSCFLEVS
jgi:hypothetical protein